MSEARVTERHEWYYLIWKCSRCSGEHRVYLGGGAEHPILSVEQEIINEIQSFEIAGPPVSVETEIRYRLLPGGGMLDLSAFCTGTEPMVPLLPEPPTISIPPGWGEPSYARVQKAVESTILDPDERAALYRELGLLP